VIDPETGEAYLLDLDTKAYKLVPQDKMVKKFPLSGRISAQPIISKRLNQSITSYEEDYYYNRGDLTTYTGAS
jgi:hypothetical protein